MNLFTIQHHYLLFCFCYNNSKLNELVNLQNNIDKKAFKLPKTFNELQTAKKNIKKNLSKLEKKTFLIVLKFYRNFYHLNISKFYNH